MLLTYRVVLIHSLLDYSYNAAVWQITMATVCWLLMLTMMMTMMVISAQDELLLSAEARAVLFSASSLFFPCEHDNS